MSLKLDASLPDGVPAARSLWIALPCTVCPRALPGDSAGGDDVFSGVARCRPMGIGDVMPVGDWGSECECEFDRDWDCDWDRDCECDESDCDCDADRWGLRYTLECALWLAP